MFMLRVTDVHGALSLLAHFHFFCSSLVHALSLTFTHLLTFILFHSGRYALDTQLTEEELQTLCQLIDRDGNGSIDFDEFKVR
jgi:Ca2+-binding EF-hand superfamily protein